MATSDETRTPCQSWKDKKYGGNLSALVAHQGVPDCRFFSSQIEGRGHEGKLKQFVPSDIACWLLHRYYAMVANVILLYI